MTHNLKMYKTSWSHSIIGYLNITFKSELLDICRKKTSYFLKMQSCFSNPGLRIRRVFCSSSRLYINFVDYYIKIVGGNYVGSGLFLTVRCRSGYSLIRNRIRVYSYRIRNPASLGYFCMVWLSWTVSCILSTGTGQY